MNYEALFSSLKEFLPNADMAKIEKLRLYQEMILTSNRQFNLTSITMESDILIKHFYDSLYPLKCIEIGDKNVLDFGSGAGFPGIPFAIFSPDAHITLLDATKKKCDFLSNVKDALSLNNVNVVNSRVENFKKAGGFDIVTARAVAPLPILLEICASLPRVGGYVLALKGANGDEELCAAKKAIAVLNLKLIKKEVYQLPEGAGERCLFLFQKEKETPHRFPRPYPEILKKPL